MKVVPEIIDLLIEPSLIVFIPLSFVDLMISRIHINIKPLFFFISFTTPFNKQPEGVQSIFCFYCSIILKLLISTKNKK